MDHKNGQNWPTMDAHGPDDVNHVAGAGSAPPQSVAPSTATGETGESLVMLLEHGGHPVLYRPNTDHLRALFGIKPVFEVLETQSVKDAAGRSVVREVTVRVVLVGANLPPGPIVASTDASIRVDAPYKHIERVEAENKYNPSNLPWAAALAPPAAPREPVEVAPLFSTKNEAAPVAAPMAPKWPPPAPETPDPTLNPPKFWAGDLVGRSERKPYYARNEWRPTWAVQFGEYSGESLEHISRVMGPDALFAYYHRGRAQIVENNAPGGNKDHATVNHSMCQFIVRLLAEHHSISEEQIPAPPPEAATGKRPRNRRPHGSTSGRGW